jgi:tetratricopeptide (TPR) repeat protein
MLDIGIAALVFVGIVIAILLFTGKLGRVKFGVSLKGVEGEVETAQSQNSQLKTSLPVSAPTPIVHVGLNEEDIKKEFESLKKELRETLESGKTKDQDEINILKQELSGVEGKLANTEQALKERNAAFTEFEKSLESEKVKNAVSEEQLAIAYDRLKNGDSSKVEDLFKQVLQEAENKAEAGAEAAFQLAKLAKVRIDYREALQLFEKAVHLSPANGFYLS